MLLIGAIVIGTAQAVVNDYQNYKHNQELDRLLAEKKKVAAVKHDSLRKTIKQIDRVFNIHKSLFVTYASRDYSLSNNSEAMSLTISNLTKVMGMFRKISYCRDVAKYLDGEYSAWEKGQQDSGEQRPTWEATNNNIISILNLGSNFATLDNANRFLSGIANIRPKTLKGSIFYVLTDYQVSAFLMRRLTMEGHYVNMQNLKSLADSLTSASKVVLPGRDVNDALKVIDKYTPDIDRYDVDEEMWKKTKNGVLFFGFAIAIFCFIKVSLLVGIIVILVTWFLWSKSSDKVDESRKKFVELRSQLREQLEIFAGYQLFEKKDLSRRTSVIEHIIKILN